MNFARMAWLLSALMAAGVLAQAQSSPDVTRPVPTPTAAGSSAARPIPRTAPPVSAEPDDDEDAPDVSLNGDDAPEPFLCEFSWVKEKNPANSRWENTGSDFPRLAPPVTKREILSPAFSRSKTPSGPSWGTCSELEESSNLAELSVVIHAHASKGRTVPDPDSGRCRWVSATPYVYGQARLKVGLGSWSGIEFNTSDNERKRISVHWPARGEPAPETDGRQCRELAEQMSNTKSREKDFRRIELTNTDSKSQL